MSRWNDLSMRDKSELIRLFVKHGVQNLDDIRNTYNSYAEGGPVNPPNKRKLQASDAVMHWLSERIAPADVTDYDPAPSYTPSDWDDTAEGMAQATYLLGRDEQRRAFLNKGYIQGQDRDYGLVQRAANATNARRGDVTPVFQTKPDDISRDNLIHIGNRLDATLSDEDDVSIYFKTPERRLRNAEHYPAALYIGTDGKPYGKGWDLNDYGLYDGQPDNYKYGILNAGAKILDRIGSPTVVTTGFGEVEPTYTHDDYARNHYLKWNPHTESYEGSSYDIVVTPNGWRGLRDEDEEYFANGGKMYFPGGPIATIGSTYSVPWEDAAEMYMNDVQAWNDVPEVTITPNGYSAANPVPEASYYRHTSNGSVPVITDESKWQEYWGNRGGQYMRDAQDKWGGLALGLTGAAVAPAIGGAFAGAGDAVMAAGNRVITNPYFNAAMTSAGAAHAGDKMLHGQVGNSLVQDAETALELMPLGLNFLPKGATFTLPKIDRYRRNLPIDENMFYHLDRGDNAGAFSNTGAYVKDGFLIPGKAASDTQVPYSWWNKGKPYAMSVKGEPMTRAFISAERPEFIQVRSKHYPIGQWNGKSGFVTKNEYVSGYALPIQDMDVYNRLPLGLGWWKQKAPTFIKHPDYLIYEDVLNGLRSARNYKQSEGYQHLVERAAQESKDLGFGTFTLDEFAQNEFAPSVRLMHKDVLNPGAYDPKTRTLFFDPLQINDPISLKSTPFHESIHYENIGVPKNPLGERWAKAFFEKQPDDIQDTLFTPYFQSGAIDREDSAKQYLAYKIEQALSQNANPDILDYLMKPGELLTNGLHTGLELGIKPFEQFPGVEKAKVIIEKAKEVNGNLTTLKSESSDDIKRFWQILTGNYAPAIVPVGIGIGLGTTQNKGK